MGVDIIERLNDADAFTATERVIARFILENRQAVQFETTSSLASKLRVSAMTIGRFARRIGFKHFTELRDQLRSTPSDTPWLSGDSLTKFMTEDTGDAQIRKHFENEVAGLAETYAQASGKRWDAIVELLSSSASVHISGTPGMTETFGYFLNFARDDVYLTDRRFDHFANLFMAAEGKCLVVIDTRRYSLESVKLTELAAERGVPTIVITDQFCDWAERLTPHVLKASLGGGLMWDSHTPLIGLLQLLASTVAQRGVAHIEGRTKELNAMRQRLSGFVGYGGRGKSA